MFYFVSLRLINYSFTFETLVDYIYPFLYIIGSEHFRSNNIKFYIFPVSEYVSKLIPLNTLLKELLKVDVVSV